MKKIAFLAFFLAVHASCSAEAVKTSANDRKDIEVTVYNNNLGLVKDVRTFTLPEGEGELRFADVAAFIMPATVHARSLGRPEDFSVLEQNYEYDLMNERKLLDKYVGKDIKIVTWNEYQDRKEEVAATLLSNNEGQIYRIGSEIFLGHPGTKVLPEIPENLIAKPTLTWLYRSGTSAAQEIEVSYLTQNIRWSADYVLTLDTADKSADLSGWVTLDNQSGTAYENAKLKLVAGDVNRAQPEFMDGGMRMVAMAKAEPAFVEKAFFEYHLYDLQRPTTIKDHQTKQISLLEAAGVPIEKEYRIEGARGIWTYGMGGEKQKQPVQVFFKFKNSAAGRLGMPLPAGVVRIYKADDAGSLQFAGEDRIEHTPKDEEVEIKAGDAFDITAERRQTDFKQLTTRLYESEWEVAVRNHKAEAVTVDVVEPVGGNWKILSNSHPYEKTSAFMLRFKVTVPKDGEVKLAYRVQTGI
ncbi:MAG: DUF4139 domain-containing protein [Candidatus Omnitrophota bacterium]